MKYIISSRIILSFLWNYWYLLVLVDFEDNFDGERRKWNTWQGLKKVLSKGYVHETITILYIFTVDKTFLQI